MRTLNRLLLDINYKYTNEVSVNELRMSFYYNQTHLILNFTKIR